MVSPFGEYVRNFLQQVNLTIPKKVRVKDNTIAYLEAGPQNGPIAILLHGIPASAELWRGVMEILSSHGWHCYAPDLPGYGSTELATDGDYSIKGASQLLCAWIEQEQMQDIWLVGHDIGGGVSQLLVTLNEQRFNKLTLSNCITADTWPIPGISVMIQSAKLSLFGIFAASGIFSSFLGRVGLYGAVANKRVLTKNIVSRVFWDSKVTTREGREKFQKMLCQLDPKQTMDNMQALSRVTLPIELVWGLKDPNQPWDGPGKILRETFPSAKIQTLPDSGHFLQIDSTQTYAEALLSKK
jgi:pimeloyl-ACP methyl ester carboxylesterase